MRNGFEKSKSKTETPGRFLSPFAARERGSPSPLWCQGHKAIHSSVQESLGGQVFFHKF